MIQKRILNKVHRFRSSKVEQANDNGKRLGNKNYITVYAVQLIIYVTYR